MDLEEYIELYGKVPVVSSKENISENHNRSSSSNSNDLQKKNEKFIAMKTYSEKVEECNKFKALLVDKDNYINTQMAKTFVENGLHTLQNIVTELKYINENISCMEDSKSEKTKNQVDVAIYVNRDVQIELIGFLQNVVELSNKFEDVLKLLNNVPIETNWESLLDMLKQCMKNEESLSLSFSELINELKQSKELIEVQ